MTSHEDPVPAPTPDSGEAENATQRLASLVYEELRRLAHRQLAGHRDGDSLTTTALVHEAYLKLADHRNAGWVDRTHFLAVSSIAMRQILVDHARERLAVKRGGRLQRVDLDDNTIAVDFQADSLVELDDALRQLSELDPRLAKVVECRFFGGLTDEETAAVVGTTARTVRRDWLKAKVLLYERLST